MPVSEKTYERIALEAPEDHWELHCGKLRRKAGVMTFPHNSVMQELGFLLGMQLRGRPYHVRTNSGHARLDSGHWYEPDVMVVPDAMAKRWREADRERLEQYDGPLPLIVEVWSPSTGDYDVDEKLPEYQRRGDEEIWRVHPYERTLIAWRRQPDGTYTETLYGGGEVRPASLAGVAIRLEELFAVLDR